MENLNELMQRHYLAIVMEEEATDGSKVFVAYNPDLDGCMSDGASAEEAIENLKEARQLYFETLLEKGLEIPKPKEYQGTKTQNTLETRVVWNVITTPIEPPSNDDTIKSIVSPSVTFVTNS